MAKIVSQLLDFTRARLGGGISIDPRPTDLADICDEVIAETETAHPKRTVLLTADRNTSGTWDRDRLLQVVSNLVANAIQHGTRDAPIDIEVISRGDFVTLQVHNEGPAIPQDLLPAIFDPFRRKSSHSSSAADGLGLGLYICREIVCMHGGEISVESSDGAGTTFVIRLPRHAKIPTPSRDIVEDASSRDGAANSPQ